MERLSEGASGLRHLRWGREILATLEAYYEHDARLTQAQRAGVLDESMKLRGLVAALSGAVKPYRDFLERSRVQVRGLQRVGRHLCDEARGRAAPLLPAWTGASSGEPSRGLVEGHRRAAELAREAGSLLRSLPQPGGKGAGSLAPLAADLDDAAALLDGFNEAFASTEARERLPLEQALVRARRSLRAGLEAMDARLAALVSPAFVDSLYPELVPGRLQVADEGDPNDDAAARPEPAAPERAGRPG